MKMVLTRNPSTPTATTGSLEIDGPFYCFTLERPEVQIPTGVYPIELTWSPRFSRLLPLLDHTAPRTDIRIHSGNWPRDTEGCILVGQSLGDNMILGSLAALNPLVYKIQSALDAKDVVSLTIV